ncbi:hypothetical protein IWZ01DRAFT_176539 [Phyllosticta capitalensis]
MYHQPGQNDHEDGKWLLAASCDPTAAAITTFTSTSTHNMQNRNRSRRRGVGSADSLQEEKSDRAPPRTNERSPAWMGARRSFRFVSFGLVLARRGERGGRGRSAGFFRVECRLLTRRILYSYVLHRLDRGGVLRLPQCSNSSKRDRKSVEFGGNDGDNHMAHYSGAFLPVEACYGMCVCVCVCVCCTCNTMQKEASEPASQRANKPT